MKENSLQMDYFATYYFANICEAVVNVTFDYLGTLDEFWSHREPEDFESFKKYSLLHNYIEFTIAQLIWEDFWKINIKTIKPDNDYKFYINLMLDHHSIKCMNFLEWSSNNGIKAGKIPDDTVHEYYQYINDLESFQRMLQQMVDEVFFIMFLNRKFLKAFNEYIADIFGGGYFDNGEKVTTPKVKRKNIPQWVKNAVFYRDRGKCVLCQKDLSGKLNIANICHYDHIVPLANYGINDVSNIQLLCETCNKKKSAGIAVTSKVYENWF